MMTPSNQITLSLPGWLTKVRQNYSQPLPASEEQMQLIIELSRLNIKHDTGGPFAAGVFEQDSGKIISLGVNRVVPCSCSSAHAEIMALSLAQQTLQQWDLGQQGQPRLQMVVNWRPCIMCFGATIWSGIHSLVIAGSGPELENITGFDEGPVPSDWRQQLEQRGIAVTDNVLKSKAIDVFREFRELGNLVYNSRQKIK